MQGLHFSFALFSDILLLSDIYLALSDFYCVCDSWLMGTVGIFRDRKKKNLV